MYNYNKKQVIHSLSFAMNSAFKLIFHNFDEMQKFVTEVSNKVLKDTKAFIGNDWDTVWGPVVYSHDPTSSFVHADNTMGAYYSRSQNLFVIAIAGTNSISTYGWIQEDFDVSKTVKWNSITGQGKGLIAKGTADGLNILVNTMKGSKNEDLLSGLKNYILKHNIKNAEVAVTGHSLGGALSPALALYLLNKESDWDPSNSMKLSAYPTAGPTFGLEGSLTVKSFVNYYEDQICNEPTYGKIDYQSYYNTIDIVPHAWEADDLEKIPVIYYPHIPSWKGSTIFRTKEDIITGTITIAAALNAIRAGIITNLYKQIKPWQQLEGSSFSKEEDNNIRKKVLKGYKLLLPPHLREYYPYFWNLARFLGQAAYQHTYAYVSLLKIEDFIKEYEDIIKKLKPSTAVEHDPVASAIKKATGFDINIPIEIDENAMEEED